MGEDSSDLNFTPFDNGLLQSSLLPRASKQSYTKDTDVCMYDTQNLDHDKAMNVRNVLPHTFASATTMFIESWMRSCLRILLCVTEAHMHSLHWLAL